MDKKQINQEILLLDKLVVEHEKIILVLKQRRNKLLADMYSSTNREREDKTSISRE